MVAQVEEPTPTPTPTPSPSPAPPEEAGRFPWGVLIAVGGGLFLLGLLLFLMAAKDPCAELLARWLALQRACDESRRQAEQGEKDWEEARNRRQESEEKLDQLCETYPPACSPESWIEDAQTGRRVTNTDLWIGRQWARQAWNQYRDAPGPERARATEEAWEQGPNDEFRRQKQEEIEQGKQRKEELERERDQARRAEEEAEKAAEEARKKADDACAKAADARRAYEECIKQKTPETPAPAPAPAGEGTDPGDTGSPPHEGDPCEGQEPRVEVIDRFGPRTIVADYTLRMVSHGYRRTEEAELMRDQLGDLARRLNEIGTALGARGALSAALRGEKLAAAAGGAGVVADVPTSLGELITEVLEKTAQLGSTVAGAAARWNARNELYSVRVTLLVRRVQLVWKQVWRCEDGVWKCQRVLEAEWGRLERGRSWSRNDITYDRIQQEARNQARALEQMVRRQLGELQQFLTKYSEGPCS